MGLENCVPACTCLPEARVHNDASSPRAKIKLILQVMEIAPEVTVVVSDIDTAWLRNPIPFFK